MKILSQSNLIEEKDWKSLEHKGKRKTILDRIPMPYALRSNTDKWHLTKLQNFCKAKDTVNKTKQQPTDWIIFLPILYLIEGTYLKYTENSTS